MAGPGPILKEIHRLRRHVADMETRIVQGPRALKIQQAKLQLQEDAFKKAQDEIKQLKLQIGDKELSIKTTQGLIKKYEKQTGDVANKKEFDALKTEIANAKANITKLEDESLELMSLVEEKAALLPGVEAQTKTARAEYAQFESSQAERLARFRDDIAKVQIDLAAVEATLPEDILIQLKRNVQARGADSLSGVENRVCTACYTEVTPQMSNDLLRGAYLVCKACGRMLYSQ